MHLVLVGFQEITITMSPQKPWRAGPIFADRTVWGRPREYKRLSWLTQPSTPCPSLTHSCQKIKPRVNHTPSNMSILLPSTFSAVFPHSLTSLSLLPLSLLYRPPPFSLSPPPPLSLSPIFSTLAPSASSYS